MSERRLERLRANILMQQIKMREPERKEYITPGPDYYDPQYKYLEDGNPSVSMFIILVFNEGKI
jgi:hypothetical protein